MKRALSLTAATALAVGSVVVAVAAAAPATATPVKPALAQPSAYVPITPVRALDTRVAGGGGPILKGQQRDLDLSKIITSTTATAAVLNVTVASPSGAGFLTVFPYGTTRPTASSINFRPGEIRSNSVTVALPESGARAISIYNLNGTTPVIVDVVGYYDSGVLGSDTASTYFPQGSPQRLLDTRAAGGGGALASGTERVVTLPEKDLGTVTAVAVNVTAVNPNGQGYLTAYANVPPSSKPFVSTVNYGTDPVTPNFAVVPATTAEDGTVSFKVANSSATTQVVVDLAGVYVSGTASGDLYVPLSPTRLADTRSGTGAKPLGANETRDFSYLASQGGTDALNLNVTAVDATNGTFLTVFPAGDDRPTASNLNPFSSFALANAVQTAVNQVDDANLAFSVYNLAGTVNVVVDLQGYFVFND